MEVAEFIRKISLSKILTGERAVAVLWLQAAQTLKGLSVFEVCCEIEQAGCGKQNITRIKQFLRRDRRVIKGVGGTYQIRPEALAKLDEQYSPVLTDRPLIKCDAVLPTDLFSNAKGYINKVVLQLNASYLYSLFDCCAVMCRRLLETLIIETYEAHNRADEIKDQDGNFLMFSGLLDHIAGDRSIHLGRSALRGLKNFKKLGDLSAHNRRFNARKPDIDQIKGDLRIACEELLHLSAQSPR
jgi:hypothetical protein